MRLLLDTHALLLVMSDSSRLSAAARMAMADDSNEKIVGAVSAFEITNKYRLGKLPDAEILMPDLEAALRRWTLPISPSP